MFMPLPRQATTSGASLGLASPSPTTTNQAYKDIAPMVGGSVSGGLVALAWLVALIIYLVKSKQRDRSAVAAGFKDHKDFISRQAFTEPNICITPPDSAAAKAPDVDAGPSRPSYQQRRTENAKEGGEQEGMATMLDSLGLHVGRNFGVVEHAPGRLALLVPRQQVESTSTAELPSPSSTFEDNYSEVMSESAFTLSAPLLNDEDDVDCSANSTYGSDTDLQLSSSSHMRSTKGHHQRL